MAIGWTTSCEPMPLEKRNFLIKELEEEVLMIFNILLDIEGNDTFTARARIRNRFTKRVPIKGQEILCERAFELMRLLDRERAKIENGNDKS